MNNQWGRSGNGTTAGGGSGAGGILFASVVSLALGAAAGYGGLRMMSGAVPASEIEQRDQRIAELARELDARTAQVEDGSQRSQALADENRTLKQQMEALRNSIGSSDDAAVAENARLTQEVIPGLKSDLQRASRRAADAEASKTKAENALQERERRLSLGADQIARLEKALDQARGAQSAEAKRLAAEAATLRRQLDEARRAEETMRTKDLPALRKEIAGRDREIADLKASNGTLTARIGALEAAARSVQQDGPGNVGDGPARDNAKPADSRNPRDASLVADAMRDAPGLDRLTGTQRDQLERTLVSGECVTNSLGGVFKRVPVLTLRNLMRDLDSDC
ncbi:MAG: hypothetical protein WA980_07140 [Shinella zoogloeoides]|uniref:hypothetical protein n=1 Tax=Shinella zoogloeoides TaxID=352475 RepID=UPI003C74D380